MKEVRKETVTLYTVYEAVDGTEFRDKAECEKYEKSAKGMLRDKLQKIILDDTHNCWDVMGGEEDFVCLALAPKTQEDVDVILQNYYLDNPWILQDTGESYKERLNKGLTEALENKDVVLFGVNDDDNMYYINTRQNIINNLNNLGKKEEQPDK